MPTVPARFSPMLASIAEEPFSRPNWVFEEKYDGVRLIAYKDGANVSMISRNAIDRASHYPEIVAAIRKLKAKTLVLDGEVVVFDPKKVSRFQLLQQSKGHPRYVVFDCLYVNGKDLRKEPLSARRAMLERTLKPSTTILLSARLAEDGLKAFQIASRRGLEGLIAKNLDSTYFEGRSSQWLKVKVHQEDEFIIGGYTQPGGARRYFGALLLGGYAKGKLLFVGKVGTGFDEETLASLHRRMQPLVQAGSPFINDPGERGATFVRPKLVAQISYAEWTDDGKLRHPVYLGLRDDKGASEVLLAKDESPAKSQENPSMALDTYRQKRDFKISPEPAGSPHAQAASKHQLKYVIQKHRATQLHYDFRLEFNGVLLSWAVPKGPSLDPSVKRLAMQVEDHPLEYGGFEGVIPESEYGGGTVMLWDNGTWSPEVPDIAAAIAKGDLKFTLNGKKLHGSWVLVRTRGFGGSDKSWLLIKHRDQFASAQDIVADEPRSVKSKRLLAEIASAGGGNVAKAATGDPTELPPSSEKTSTTKNLKRKKTAKTRS